MKGLWHGIQCPDGNKAYSSSIFLVLLSGYLRGVEVGLLWPIPNTCATSHGKETRQYHLLQIWMSLNFLQVKAKVVKVLMSEMSPTHIQHSPYLARWLGVKNTHPLNVPWVNCFTNYEILICGIH